MLLYPTNGFLSCSLVFLRGEALLYSSLFRSFGVRGSCTFTRPTVFLRVPSCSFVVKLFLLFFVPIFWGSWFMLFYPTNGFPSCSFVYLRGEALLSSSLFRSFGVRGSCTFTRLTVFLHVPSCSFVVKLFLLFFVPIFWNSWFMHFYPTNGFPSCSFVFLRGEALLSSSLCPLCLKNLYGH